MANINWETFSFPHFTQYQYQQGLHLYKNRIGLCLLVCVFVPYMTGRTTQLIRRTGAQLVLNNQF